MTLGQCVLRSNVMAGNGLVEGIDSVTTREGSVYLGLGIGERECFIIPPPGEQGMQGDDVAVSKIGQGDFQRAAVACASDQCNIAGTGLGMEIRRHTPEGVTPHSQMWQDTGLGIENGIEYDPTPHQPVGGQAPTPGTVMGKRESQHDAGWD